MSALGLAPAAVYGSSSGAPSPSLWLSAIPRRCGGALLHEPVIETSSITLHADEVFGRCFIDVFSCRPFDPDVAAGTAVEHFGGTPTVTVLQR